MTSPVLTVITPVFNGRRYIEGCLQNVVDQACPDAVHLVMDGGSTDGTPEIVRARMATNPRLQLVSERDTGQSNAMNKGIRRATTDYIGFLNVDDFYEPGTLNRAVGLIRALDQPTMLVGNCNFRNVDDGIESVNRPSLLGIEYLVMGTKLNQFPVNPSAYFYPRALHDRIGLYDENENYLLDLKFLLDAVQAIPTKYYNETWGNFRVIPGTKTFEHSRTGEAEIARQKLFRSVYARMPLKIQIRVALRYVLWSLDKQRRGLAQARRAATMSSSKNVQPAQVTETLPAVSIIIATRDRAAALAGTLAKLAALDPGGLPALEVVLIDNGSTDDTAAVIARFEAGCRFPVKALREPRAGKSIALNRGIAAARHPVLLFTDDDCLPAPEWAAAAAACFAGDTAQVIAGRVELFDPSHLQLAYKTSPDSAVLRFPSALFDGFLHGANLAMGRVVIDRLGGFDERFGPGTRLIAEDTELALRAFYAGLPVRYEPSFVVAHNHGRPATAAAWRAVMGGYARGAGGMAMKYLLRGHGDMPRIIYWRLVTALRLGFADRRRWYELALWFIMLGGACRFLLLEAYRPAQIKPSLGDTRPG